MHLFIAMFRGGRFLSLFDFVFMPLAAIVVYPERTLEWLVDSVGKPFTELPAIMLRAAAVLGIAALSLLLVFTSAKFVWWWPLAYVGVFVLIRTVKSGILTLLGLDKL